MSLDGGFSVVLSGVSRVFVEGKVGAARWRGDTAGHDGMRALLWGQSGRKPSELCIGLYQHATEMESDSSFRRLGSTQHEGDVNDIAFVDGSLVLTASSSGSVFLYQLQNNPAMQPPDNESQSVDPMSFKPVSRARLHAGAATSIDAQSLSSDVVSAGQDGCLHILAITPSDLRSQRSIDRASTSSIYHARFTGVHSFASCGMGGRLCLWDMRSDSNRPSNTLLNKHCRAFTALNVHPARSEIIATGSDGGVLNVWDIRNSSVPTFSVRAHDSPVWGALFIAAASTSLVTCGEDGALLHWDFNKDRRDPTEIRFSSQQEDNIKVSRLHTSGMPLNCVDFDSATHMLVGGADSDSLFLLPFPI